MSLRVTRTIELRSANVAAGSSSPLLSCAGSRINVHVLVAPGNFVNIQGSANNNPAECNNLTIISAAGGGYAAAANLAAGHYVIVDRPNYVRVNISQDANAPRTSRVELQLDPEE